MSPGWAKGILVTAALRDEPFDIRRRLGELGLEQEALLDVARRGYLAFITCTANHPPFIPGIWAWGETVRALREYLLPKGWNRSDEDNYSVVMNASRSLAIAVATGDEGTGKRDSTPSTKAAKGPSTFAAVLANQEQLSLFSEPLPFTSLPRWAEQSGERVTWILLIHRARDELRCELSLPFSIGSGGRIDGWQERILLGSVGLDPELKDIVPPPQPDITVEVKRRA